MTCKVSLQFLLAALLVPAYGADMLLVNGRILTMNSRQPAAEAVAVRSGRIQWVGSSAEARRRFPQLETMDLAGATVLPGIIDAHGHMVNLGQSLLRLNLKGVSTPEEAADRVRERARNTMPGEWITGWGWDEGAWATHYPTHQLLSSAAPNNPVALTGLHTYAVWANRKALDAAGITRTTPDPAKGKIIRDTAGDATGVLTDQAQQMIARLIPAPTGEQRKQAIMAAAQECVRHGLTEIHEAGIADDDLEAYRELIRDGRLPVRIYAMLDAAKRGLIDSWLARGPEIDPARRLTVRSIKIFADGALGSRGAALLEPYSDAPGRGVITTSGESIYQLTVRALRGGFQVATHAIGDGANRFVLDAYERALREVRARDPRLRIEHAQVLSLADIPRFAKLGVIASMQPAHCTSDMGWAEDRVGPQRIRGAYAWHSVLKSGAHLPLSSDFPGETLDPFAGMYAAVTRQDPAGKPDRGWHPEERLTLDEALRGYTVEAAYSAFEEKDKGSIEPGKLADFTVIAEDIAHLPPHDLLNVRVLQTIVGGELVYSGKRLGARIE